MLKPNALVRIGNGAYAVPNSRATQVELWEGLTAHSQNNWPSLRYDAGSLANSCARLLPAERLDNARQALGVPAREEGGSMRSPSW